MLNILPQQSAHFRWNIIVRDGHIVGKNCCIHFGFPVRYRFLRCLWSKRCITCALKIFHSNSNHIFKNDLVFQTPLLTSLLPSKLNVAALGIVYSVSAMR